MDTETVLVLFMAALMDSQGVQYFQEDLLPSTHQTEVQAHCLYPCTCGPPPRCPPGVPVIKDGCGCCPLCARQPGQSCDGSALCDESRGLVCQYPSLESRIGGTCKAITGNPCTIYNQTYDNGETFMLDCRTQCACKNGTYACASLCPQENISPRGSSCSHPRLVEVPGQCCREWLCDTVQRPPQCRSNVSKWTACSSACGLGLSHRISNLNSECSPRNETRLCQLRPCPTQVIKSPSGRSHHIRKGHECKATQRLSVLVSLVFGRCHSRKLYRPRACGVGCVPELSSTVRVEFVCGPRAGLADVELGSDLWRVDVLTVEGRVHTLSVDVQWVLKCRCGVKCSVADTQLVHRVHRTT